MVRIPEQSGQYLVSLVVLGGGGVGAGPGVEGFSGCYFGIHGQGSMAGFFPHWY